MDSKRLLALCATLAVVTPASGHGYVTQIVANGKAYTGYNPTIYPWLPRQESPGWANQATDLGFVPSTAQALQGPDIVCHIKAENPAAQQTVEVAAGSTVFLQWSPWPESHKGPVMDYLARCGESRDACAGVDKTKLEFFKIAERGQVSLGSGNGRAGRWAVDELREAGDSWNVTIPADIAPGAYVLRHEQLALHSAYGVGGAQFYPQCVSIVVTGGGSSRPKGTLGTELYKSNDPGVLYGIYNDETKPVYKIPGPKLYWA